LKRLFVALIVAPMLASCAPALDTDQARLCRMALPALMPDDAHIAIVAQTPDADGRGLNVAFIAKTPDGGPASHVASCRFREPGRPRQSRDLESLTLDGRRLSECSHF
jgi:branched-chain amino acid transport system permease protein